MAIDLSQFLETFLQESADNLEQIESGLLALRATPDDKDILNAVFRGAHSIKGSAGTFGLDSIVRFTHTLESLLDQMRNGLHPADSATIELLLQSADMLHLMLDRRGETPDGMSSLLDRLNSEAGLAASAPTTSAPAASTATAWSVSFRPNSDILEHGSNPLLFLRNLTDLGEVSDLRLHQHGLPEPAKLDTTSFHLGWTLTLHAACSRNEIAEVFEFVEGLAEISIEPLAAAAVAAPIAMPAPDASPRPGARDASASIRVSTAKVDTLIDLVGEMVIAHSATSGLVENLLREASGGTLDALSRLRESVAQLERNTRDLHERIMAVRMLPVGGLFSRFHRVVHDLAQRTGKQIVLSVEGEETEVDRGLLEQLSDPLTHLIRNAADHGLETPAERLAAGKPAQGTIRLSARHEGGAVLIEIRDDGRGLDLERIRAKALRLGLIPPNTQLDDDDLAELIFAPGFSTATSVSEFSGRGVGMDVVRRNLESMNGAISLQSRRGLGLTVRLRLPLTLAILDGLAIEVCGQTYVLPITAILETAPVELKDIRAVADRGEVIILRGQPVSVLRLETLFHLTPPAGAEQQARRLALVLEQDNRKVALLIDEIIGQQQFVIKSLERHFRRVDGAMGATILGDGRAALILDATSLLSHRTSRPPSQRPLVA